MSSKHSTPGYYIAVLILAVLLLGAVVLVIAMIARPGVPGASVLAVTDRVPVACAGQKQNATCFETQVTNNGGTTSTFRCEVRPTDDAQATFIEGATTTQILLGADQSVHLDSMVVSTTDATPSAPSVSCEPVSN
jgi:hypothetical protein